MTGFKKATKAAAKLRAAVFGPSGAGKTFTSLRVATGLADGKPIAFIDTERGSAVKYSDRFQFDVLELEDRSVAGYCEAIELAEKGGYSVLIIDSLTHAWQELLEEIERLAKAKYRGNTWSAWSEGTPLQRKLIDAILGFPGHIMPRCGQRPLGRQTRTATAAIARCESAWLLSREKAWNMSLTCCLSCRPITLPTSSRTGQASGRTG